MKKISGKIVAIILITILALAIIPTKGFASNENIQIVKTNEDYIIYVKDKANKEFKFAVANEKLDSESIELNFVNAVKDNAGNNVALLKEKAKYLYVKDGADISTIQLNFEEKNIISQKEIADVENITNKIKTEVSVIRQRDEQIEKVKHEETVGGLEIKDDKDASYEYVITKLPDNDYSQLKELTEKLNSEYEGKDIYLKIEFVKQSKELLNNVINKANSNKVWKKVENMQILQPSEAKKEDQYVVLLKKVKGEETNYDIKLMVSDRTDVAPEKKEEIIETKRTSMLPVTGDNLLLFGILAVIILALIIVFVKMKNVKKNGRH